MGTFPGQNNSNNAAPSGLPPGKWSQRKVFRIRFSSVNAAAQVFTIGDDAGTNGAAVNANLTTTGTFGATSEAVFKSLCRENKHFITDIKINASAGAVADAVGLKIQRTLNNGSFNGNIMENADVTTQFDNQNNIRPWKDVNWMLMATDMISGSVAIGSVTPTYVELVIGYHTKISA